MEETNTTTQHHSPLFSYEDLFSGNKIDESGLKALRQSVRKTVKTLFLSLYLSISLYIHRLTRFYICVRRKSNQRLDCMPRNLSGI